MEPLPAVPRRQAHVPFEESAMSYVVLDVVSASVTATASCLVSKILVSANLWELVTRNETAAQSAIKIMESGAVRNATSVSVIVLVHKQGRHKVQ